MMHPVKKICFIYCLAFYCSLIFHTFTILSNFGFYGPMLSYFIVNV